jgi:hypothetical protein
MASYKKWRNFAMEFFAANKSKNISDDFKKLQKLFEETFCHFFSVGNRKLITTRDVINNFLLV